MKCVRDTGWPNFKYSTWKKRCDEYAKKFGKFKYPYNRRARTCERALNMIEIKTRGNRDKRKIYWNTKYRILSRSYEWITSF